MDKDKKKTLTISTNLKTKINTSSVTSGNKKSYSIDKKKPFKSNRNINKININQTINKPQENRKKNFARKFVEQQATKEFIKKDSKPAGKK